MLFLIYILKYYVYTYKNIIMSQSGIANDIVSEILKHRSVYIVFRQDLYIEYAKAEILGIYFVFNEAKLALLTHAFNNELSTIIKNNFVNRLIEMYDPSKRFYKYSADDILRDRWISFTAVSKYNIQEWSSHDKIPKQITDFNFDRWFKNNIFQKFLNSQETPDEIRKYILEKLTDWKNKICNDILIPDEFKSSTLWIDMPCKSYEYSTIKHEAWINRFKNESTDDF